MNSWSAPRRWVVRGVLCLGAISLTAAAPPARATGERADHPAALALDSGNLLVNPGFEAPYVKQCCHTEEGLVGLPIDEIQVAHGWLGWWYPPGSDDAHPEYCGQDAPDKCQAWHRPEWRDAAPFAERIHEGEDAQKYFTFYSVHEAGMVQQVQGIPPGAKVRFSVYMQAWSNDTDSPTSSGQDSMGMKVGIDPTGDVNPWSPNIVWSAVHDAFDAYQQYTVEAVAQGDTVTVFTHSQPMWGYKHNDVYVDDASLVVLGDAPLPAPTPAAAPAGTALPAPVDGGSLGRGVAWSADDFPAGTETYIIQPGDTLWVIAARHGLSVDELRQWNGLTGNKIYVGQVLALSRPPAPAATEVAAPTASPAAGATAVARAVQPIPAGPTGDLCVQVYADQNGDGVRDSADARGSPPDMAFSLLRVEAGQEQVVGGYRTDGARTDFCFPGLPAADYQLTLTLPDGYAVTTPPISSLTVAPGATVQVQVGLAPAEVVAALRARRRGLTIAGSALAGLLVAYGAWLAVYRRRPHQVTRGG